MSDPFVKLYATLLESSLWWGEDATTRLVWITLLVAADHEGIYQGTLPGLAGKARVSLDEARHAVWRLQQPDEESRTKDYDGRRIEVVPGVGYRLLNYQKYRDKRSPKQVADAVYKARQRERQKSPDESDMSTESAEVSLISTLSSGISDLGSDPGARETETVASAGSFPAVLRRVPDGYVPSEALLAQVAAAGCPRDVFDRRLAELRTGPIGGARGVFPAALEKFLLGLASKWRVWEATDVAKQQQMVGRHRKDAPNQPNAGITGLEKAKVVR